MSKDQVLRFPDLAAPNICGVRSFSRLFRGGLAALRKIVFTGPGVPAGEPTVPGFWSLQGALQALQEPFLAASHDCPCMQHYLEHTAAERFTLILVQLTPLKRVRVANIGHVLGLRRKVIEADLDFMTDRLHLPIDRARAGVCLTRPVQLCPWCEAMGAELRQSKDFHRFHKRTLFKAVLPGNAGPSSRVQSVGDQGGPPVFLPSPG